MLLKRPKDIFVFFLILFSLNYFSPVDLPDIFKQLRYVYLIIAICISIFYLDLKGKKFSVPVALIYISILISIPFAHFTWQQSWSDCFIGTLPYMIWICFFYLLHVKYPIEKLEKMLLIYGTLYIILYFFQLAHSNSVYFGFDEEFQESRGITRIIFPGGSVFFISVFIALNRFNLKSKYKIVWLAFLIAGILIPILQVTRQLILFVLIIYTYHVSKKIQTRSKVMLVILITGITIYLTKSNIPVVQGIKDAQLETNSEGLENIRIKAAKYFINDLAPNNINKFLGNGVPHGEKSKYNIYTTILADTKGYYLSDVGIVGIYIMFGIIAVLGYCLIWIRSFTIRLPEKYIYLKYYLWFLLFTCLTSNTVYGEGYLITNVLAIYSYQSISENLNMQKSKRSLLTTPI